MPVAQRGCAARREPGDVDAELAEPDHVAELSLFALVEIGRPLAGIAADLLERHLVDVDLGHHTRSMIVAVPMPMPMQSVTSAVCLPLRSSSSSTVPKIIAPVAPSGCPIAIAPPLTLILSCEMSSACI